MITLNGDDRERLVHIVDMMRHLSQLTDPQEMVRYYGEHMRSLLSIDGRLSLSRRGLTAPNYRITRSPAWPADVNPWTDRERLPLLEGGLLGELVYAEKPVVIDDIRLAACDPAVEHLAGYRSCVAIPLYENGVGVNMVLLLRKESGAFAHEQLPELVWMSNLFGRATSSLVLSEELQRAYRALDKEFRMIGDIQRSLLPTILPTIAGLDLAAHYQPSQRAGGDYYDFFQLPDDQWGILVADVSGHGPAAAVLMAVTHCIAHTRPGPPMPPGKVLDYLNHHLTIRYTNGNGDFVTAFYALYNPRERKLTYASAGHNPPRLKRCQDGSLLSLDQAGGLPLGVRVGESYEEFVQPLQIGDQIVFYTDGITEAHSADGRMFGVERLDQVLSNCASQAAALLNEVLRQLIEFAGGRPADDDRTIIVARVTAKA
jgi:phosphoserine phosphatase RsbU/P